MNSPTSVQADPVPDAGATTPPPPPAAEPLPVIAAEPLWWRQPAVWLAAGALLAAGGNWLHTKQQLAALQLEAGSFNKESRQIADRNSELAQQMQTKLAVLESKFNDSQSQQLALQAMYQELSRDSDETSLADVEQAAKNHSGSPSAVR